MADFKITPNGNLAITIDDEDREEIEELREREGWNDDDVFFELIDSQLCNGWENIPHIACWGNNINLTEDHETDDYGDTIRLGKVYTWTNYQLISEIQALLEEGTIILTMYE